MWHLNYDPTVRETPWVIVDSRLHDPFLRLYARQGELAKSILEELKVCHPDMAPEALVVPSGLKYDVYDLGGDVLVGENLNFSDACAMANSISRQYIVTQRDIHPYGPFVSRHHAMLYRERLRDSRRIHVLNRPSDWPGEVKDPVEESAEEQS